MGTYNSTFTQRDVVDQAYDNPAGDYNYTELIDQAKDQTYVITDLFSSTDIPKSVFSEFLPYEAFPSTEFLSLPPPVNPNPTTMSSSIVCPSSFSSAIQTSTQPASTTVHLIIPSSKLLTALTEQTSSAVAFQIPASSSVIVVTTPTNELQNQFGGGSAVTSAQFVFYIIISSITVLLPLL